MTSNDTNIRASFRNLDTPIAVDPAFAERVHAAVANLQTEPESPNTQHPIPNTESPTSNLQPSTSRRWQDLAAAAVLLLALGGLISGAIRVLRTDEPGSIILIDAPQTPALGDAQIASSPIPAMADIPVINSFGSATNDGNLPGVMPPPGTTYDLLWEGPEPDPEPGYNGNQAFIAGNVVVRAIGTHATGVYLSVHDLESGEEHWRTDLALNFPYAITPEGILIARPVGPNQIATPLDYGLILYDLTTGTERWNTGNRFVLTDFQTTVMIVDGEMVYFRDGETSLVALDLTTGEEHWTFDAAQGRTREEMLGDCIPTNPDCGQRAYQSAAIAIVGDVAYRYVPISGELVAINTADGTLRWVHNLAERTSIPAPIVRLIGTEFGVIPVVAEGPGTTEGRYLGFWQASDGAEIWTKAIQVTSAYVNGDALIISRIDPENPSECCLISTLDIRTGDALLDDVTILNVGAISIYPSDGTLMLSDIYVRSSTQDRVPPTSFVFPSSGFASPIAAEQLISGCSSITPGTDGRHVVCYLPNGQFVIYRADEIPVIAEPTQSVEFTTDGCFEIGDTVTMNEDAVNLREAPEVAQDNVLKAFDPGSELTVVAEDGERDADGTVWCRVRDPETALTGYIAEEFLEPAEP